MSVKNQGRVDVCCLQKVRWKGQGAHFVGLRDEDINCGCQEITQDLKGLNFGEKGNI